MLSLWRRESGASWKMKRIQQPKQMTEVSQVCCSYRRKEAVTPTEPQEPGMGYVLMTGGEIPVAVVERVRSSRQREEGLGFGERRAAVAVKRASPGDGGRGGDGGRQAREGCRGGRRANRLREMLLQAFLLTPLQARHPGRDHQPRRAAGARRQGRAAFAHRGAHIGGSGLSNLRGQHRRNSGEKSIQKGQKQTGLLKETHSAGLTSHYTNTTPFFYLSLC